MSGPPVRTARLPYGMLMNKADTQQPLLVYRVGNNKLCIPAVNVQAVETDGRITPLPMTPAHVLGILQFRGEAIAAFDLRILLGSTKENENGPFIISALDGDRLIAWRVDDVDELVEGAELEWSACSAGGKLSCFYRCALVEDRQLFFSSAEHLFALVEGTMADGQPVTHACSRTLEGKGASISRPQDVLPEEQAPVPERVTGEPVRGQAVSVFVGSRKAASSPDPNAVAGRESEVAVSRNTGGETLAQDEDRSPEQEAAHSSPSSGDGASANVLDSALVKEIRETVPALAKAQHAGMESSSPGGKLPQQVTRGADEKVCSPSPAPSTKDEKAATSSKPTVGTAPTKKITRPGRVVRLPGPRRFVNAGAMIAMGLATLSVVAWLLWPGGQEKPSPSPQWAEVSRGQSGQTREPVVAQEAASGTTIHENSLSTQMRSHRVLEGDTLWHITSHYLGDPYRYHTIARQNGIEDPNLIYPGALLQVFPLDKEEGASRSAD